MGHHLPTFRVGQEEITETTISMAFIPHFWQNLILAPLSVFVFLLLTFYRTRRHYVPLFTLHFKASK